MVKTIPAWLFGAILVTGASTDMAHAAVSTAYAAGVSSAANPWSVASDPVDLPSSPAGYLVTTTVGVSLANYGSSAVFSPLAGTPGLQVVQGCTQHLTSCAAGDWQSIAGLALLANGVSSFAEGTVVESRKTVDFALPPGFASLRLLAGGTITAGDFAAISGSLKVTPVPEPGTWAIMAGGLVAVALTIRRRLPGSG
jgi:hypothetical protein